MNMAYRSRFYIKRQAEENCSDEYEHSSVHEME